MTPMVLGPIPAVRKLVLLVLLQLLIPRFLTRIAALEAKSIVGAITLEFLRIATSGTSFGRSSMVVRVDILLGM